MNELALYPSMLLAIRAACHFLIFLRVFTYFHEGGHHRWTVGSAAALLAGFNIAECVRVISNFHEFASGSIEIYLPGAVFFFTVFIVWSDGNVARLLPRKLAEKLP